MALSVFMDVPKHQVEFRVSEIENLVNSIDLHSDFACDYETCIGSDIATIHVRVVVSVIHLDVYVTRIEHAISDMKSNVQAMNIEEVVSILQVSEQEVAEMVLLPNTPESPPFKPMFDPLSPPRQEEAHADAKVAWRFHP